LNDYTFIKDSNKEIDGVDDVADFKSLSEAMTTIKFTMDDQNDLFRAVAGVLHLGNLTFGSGPNDQAHLTENGCKVAEHICHVLGIAVGEFTKSLLTHKIKAGRDWVVQARDKAQCQYSVEALARAMYERMFGSLVDKINECLYTPTSVKATYIGVLDIAGFEIFDINSFEQLFINYTNEKLQQFFNHRMFILEQEKYRREGIEWKFIDFGLDLQPTIDLIEKTKVSLSPLTNT
jgi:myosin protein heavy chain